MADSLVESFDKLQAKVGANWAYISRARLNAAQTCERLSKLKYYSESDTAPEDVAIVVFGSLARGEYTSSSDVDWTLLIDGQSDPQHSQLTKNIQQELEKSKYTKPSDGGAFGSMSSSHELIHNIGGQEDTNQNMTRRILILLESQSVGPHSIVHDRVTKGILKRYIDCDPSVSRFEEPEFRVPRFLLNDVVRYWRTLAVDYAAKKWQQASKWALRNAKLRMARKLLFAKGLLTCLEVERLKASPGLTLREIDADTIRRCEQYVHSTALDVLCAQLLRLEVGDQKSLSRLVLDSYDRYLAILDNEDHRTELENLPFENAAKSSIFREVRDLSDSFQEGLTKLFFETDEGLTKLIMKYGIF